MPWKTRSHNSVDENGGSRLSYAALTAFFISSCRSCEQHTAWMNHVVDKELHASDSTI